MRSVLVVEDDTDVFEALSSLLLRHGYAVQHATTGAEALAQYTSVDLVLLDLGLPDFDGLEVCRAIRTTSNVPIVAVTARGTELDKVTALSMGADDFVVKPYGILELLARMDAVLRRSVTPAAPSGDRFERTVGGVTVIVDHDAHRVWLDRMDLSLTKKEFGILSALTKRPGVAIGRVDLLKAVWGPEWAEANRTLDVHVCSLRRKLCTAGSLIEVVRGFGYRIAE